MKAFTFIPFFVITGFTFSQVTSDLSKMKLEGKVKLMQLTYIEAAPHYEESDAGTYYFNSSGFLDSMVHHGRQSPISYSKTIYIYNNKMRLINSIQSISIDGQFDDYAISDWRRRKMFYNSAGLLVKTKEVDKDTVLTREIKYKYDSLRRIKKVVDNDFSNQITTNWTYNEEGAKSIEISTRGLTSKNVFFYNKKGLLVKHQNSVPADNEKFYEEKYTYSFNEKGSWYMKHISDRCVTPNNIEDWKEKAVIKRSFTYFK